MNSRGHSFPMKVDVAPSNSTFEVVYKILTTLDSERWKNPCGDAKAEAITEHLQGLAKHLLTTFSESKKYASTGTKICQEMLLFCKRMLDENFTKTKLDDGISQVSQQTRRLTTGAKELEERFQTAQKKVDEILTILPVSVVSQTGEVKDPLFEDARFAFFIQVAHDLDNLKRYLCEMVFFWDQLQWKITTMVAQAEKALTHWSKPEFGKNDVDMAWMQIEFFYRDYTLRIENLFKLPSLSSLFSRTTIEIEIEKADIDPQFKAILPRDMKNVFEAACRCVSVLEPLNQATSPYPLATAIIERTRAEFSVVFDLLSTSRDVVQKGIKVVKDASYLFGNVLDRKKNRTELEEFIEQMISEVEEASSESVKIRTGFRVVAGSFAQISKDIPTMVERVEKERRKKSAKIQLANPQISFRVFRFASHVPLRGDISLPSPLPLVLLVGKAIEAKTANRSETRQFHYQSIETALVVLKDVGGFLDEVGQGFGKFIKFWTSANLLLEAVKERIQEMRDYPETWSFRLELAEKQCEEAAAIYHHYVLQIGYLCQFAAPVPTTHSSKSRIRSLLK